MDENGTLLEEILTAAADLGVSVSEEDLSSDLDTIAEGVHAAFWNEMYHDGEFEEARSAADEILGDLLDELPYISEHLSEPGWDESEEYDVFREVVLDEVFDRAGIPLDEDEAADMLADQEDESEDEGYDEIE